MTRTRIGATISVTQDTLSDRSFNLGSGHGFAVGYVELVATKLMHGGRQHIAMDETKPAGEGRPHRSRMSEP